MTLGINLCNTYIREAAEFICLMKEIGFSNIRLGACVK